MHVGRERGSAALQAVEIVTRLQKGHNLDYIQ